jgi:RNA polymerase sigma-70 factor (ECF subfamily)
VEIRDEADRAAQALGELDEDRRKVIILAIRHGLTHAEIARATGLPLGTVKTHARRGLIQLRDRLNAGTLTPLEMREAR